MTIEYVPVSGGGRLWAEKSGDGAPMVLLHGSVQDSRLWDGVFAELGRRHTVIRYDARGLGRSTPPTAPFSYEDDLLAVLDHFGIERAALVGLSMGAEVSLDFTLEHPERVRSLTLVGASASGHDWPPSAELDDYTAANRGHDADRLAELELTLWASLGDRAPGYPAITTMVTENAKVRAAVEKGHVRFASEDAVAHLAQVAVPTTAVVGDHDHPEIGVIARRLAEGIPGARLEIVAGADHYLPLRTPERLAEIILGSVRPFPLDMQDVAIRLTSRFGPSAESWLATIPAVTARLAATWGFTPGELFESGASSVIMRCRWPDGTPAVIKFSPDKALLAKQVDMLRLFAPTGRVPAVLAADAETGAMALEEIRPGTEAEHLPPDSLPQQWGDLLAALHSVTPPANWPLTLRGRLDEAFARIGRRLAEPAIAARIDSATWQRAIDRCAGLLDSSSAPVLLHGDLHLGNALDGGPSRGLIAIDPKACIGDPCFDAVDYVLAAAGQEGIPVRCHRVATACGLDGDRLHAWAQAIAPMTAIAHLTYDGPPPAIDELLALSC
jgi:streptomycin 6-kinase